MARRSTRRMSLLPVDEAVRRLLDGVQTTDPETVALAEAAGRVLAADLKALRTQPPFHASAMDGYAVRAADATAGARLKVIGVSRAGERFAGRVGPGQAARIFTGAPVPEGADAILIQENADLDGDEVRVREAAEAGRFIRPAGLDFRIGDALLRQGRVLDSRAVALTAAMGHAEVAVRRKPRVAILANGDELVPPGAEAGPDQIVSSNGIGLAAFVQGCGGDAVDLGIAPDRIADIGAFVDKAAGSDVLVVVGGASVGEHDLVQSALIAKGMELDFWRIAMRPGKPLMVGTLRRMRVLGLPGNPVSAFVCGHIFLKPLIRGMLGLPTAPDPTTALLGAGMAANDGRQDYVRARLSVADGERIAIPFPTQDSSMLAMLAAADALIVRPARAPAASRGERVPVMLLQE
jgi:molybdopterin molybdotransferase